MHCKALMAPLRNKTVVIQMNDFFNNFEQLPQEHNARDMIKILRNTENVQCLIFGAHIFNFKSVRPKIKHCTFSALHRISILSRA